MKNLISEGGIAENLYSKKPTQNPVLTGKQPSAQSKAPAKPDQDLVASMASRLAKSEQTCNSQRQEIKEKAQQIEKMQQELDQYKKASNLETAK